MIKIGTSRKPGVRMDSIGRKHGSLLLVAIHGGWYAEESAVHRRFKALHIGGEWFRPEMPLLDHIAKVRKTMGNTVPENDDLPRRMNRLEFCRLVRQAKERTANPAA
jgi:ribosomal protein S30